MLELVGRGKKIDAPERQDDKRKTGHRPPGESPPGLGEAPVQDQQGQIKAPDQPGPDHFGIGRRAQLGPVFQQEGNQPQPHRQEQEPGPQQPAGDFFQPVNGGHDREDGAQLVEFQVVFLGQVHDRRDRA